MIFFKNRKLIEEMDYFHSVEDPWDAYLTHAEIAKIIETNLPCDKVYKEVLDIGVGDGVLWTNFTKLRVKKLVALDISKKAIQKLKKLKITNVEELIVKRRDIHSFKTFRKYSLIISTFSINYLEIRTNIKRFIKTMYNIKICLDKNGVFVIVAPIYSDDDLIDSCTRRKIFENFKFVLDYHDFIIIHDTKIEILILKVGD